MIHPNLQIDPDEFWSADVWINEVVERHRRLTPLRKTHPVKWNCLMGFHRLVKERRVESRQRLG